MVAQLTFNLGPKCLLLTLIRIMLRPAHITNLPLIRDASTAEASQSMGLRQVVVRAFVLNEVLLDEILVFQTFFNVEFGAFNVVILVFFGGGLRTTKRLFQIKHAFAAKTCEASD